MPTSTPDRLDSHNLLLYQSADGQAHPVTTPEDWRRRREQILAGMQAVMGPLPGPQKRCPVNMRVIQDTACDGYVRKLIHYQSEPNGWVPAYLLIPNHLFASNARPAPAVLALHPTHAELGHKTIVFPEITVYQPYAHELAQRGFVTLAPAYPLLGQYAPDLAGLGYVSGTMKAVWDNIRGLDLLDSLPFVRKGHFAAVGHSLGGHNSVYTSVFDDRIKAVVSSCGLDSFVDYYRGRPEVWSPGRGWTSTRYMPRLSAYAGRQSQIPFDFPELIAALAPRPCLISAPISDENFNWQSVDRVAAAARPIYQLLGVPNNLQVIHPQADHDFPLPTRLQAYELLERHLKI